MNREIKFRAFDQESKQMNYDVDLNVCKYNGDIIMQFTGCKDKNGKEIYEGDIVKRIADYYDWDKPDGEERCEREEISFIEYRGNGFWVESENFGYEGENLWDWDKMEVIGNIYENSKLLNKQD